MKTASPRKTRKPAEPFTASMKVKASTHRRLREVADGFGLSLGDTIDAMARGWAQLSPEEQLKAMQRT